MTKETSQPAKTKVEYEGQTYEIDSAIIEGLDDGQILNLLAQGFPGMAGGKIERSPDGSIKIIKRVGTKGNIDFVELLKSFPADTLAGEIQELSDKLSDPQLTIAQWSQLNRQLNFERIEQTIERRKQTIHSAIIRLHNCSSRVVPLI